MSNDLILQDDFNRQLVDLDKIQDTCRKLLSTKHYAKLGEEGIHAILSRAKALGIHPFEALNNGFYVVQGRVGMSTEMMAALVRKRGHSITKDKMSNNECVILHGKRADSGDTWTCTFTRADAEAAGLWNTATWKKYPGVMLYNRCMSMLFRQLFPDLSLGAGYVEDELKEIAKVDEYKLPASEYEFVESQKSKKIDFTVKVNHASPPENMPDKKSDPILPITHEEVEILNRMEPLLDDEYRTKYKTYMKKLGISSFSEMNHKQFKSFFVSFDENIKKQDEAVNENNQS